MITTELSKLFKVDKTSHIVFDDKYLDELDKQMFNLFKIFNVKGSGSHVNGHKKDWIKNMTHLNDQLKEMNIIILKI